MDIGGALASASQQLPWLAPLEDLADRFLRQSRRYLPSVARFCLVLPFIEHAIRLLATWDGHANYMSSYLDVSRSSGDFLVVCNILAQLGASSLILVRKFPEAACGVLAVLTIEHILIYRLYQDLYVVGRSVSMIGGIFLLWVESLPQAHVTGASLPGFGDEKPKNVVQLVARILVAIMFLTLIHFDWTPLQIIYNIIGVPLALLIMLGYQTKVASFVLVVICITIQVLYHAFWWVPVTERLHDILRYHFFQLCAIIGSLLFIVALGPGEVSLDDRRKRW